jgi:hypothetical protein
MENDKGYHRLVDYKDVISISNLFVKSTLKTLCVPMEQVMKDFDKVIFLLRRNLIEHFF